MNYFQRFRTGEVSSQPYPFQGSEDSFAPADRFTFSIHNPAMQLMDMSMDMSIDMSEWRLE